MSFLSEAGSKARGRLLIALAVLACGGLLGVGCGGDDDSTPSDSGTSTEAPSATDNGGGDSGAAADPNAAAIAVFDSSGCAGCHTLGIADASGAVGPNLDDTSLSTEQIVAQIKAGGGAMPPYEDQLSEAQINSLAELISSS